MKVRQASQGAVFRFLEVGAAIVALWAFQELAESQLRLWQRRKECQVAEKWGFGFAPVFR